MWFILKPFQAHSQFSYGLKSQWSTKTTVLSDFVFVCDLSSPDSSQQALLLCHLVWSLVVLLLRPGHFCGCVLVVTSQYITVGHLNSSSHSWFFQTFPFSPYSTAPLAVFLPFFHWSLAITMVRQLRFLWFVSIWWVLVQSQAGGWGWLFFLIGCTVYFCSQGTCSHWRYVHSTA